MSSAVSKQLRQAAVLSVATAAAVAGVVGIASAVGGHAASGTAASGYGYACPTGTGYGYGYSTATASATTSPSATSSTGLGLPTGLPTLPTIIPTTASASASATATATASATDSPTTTPTTGLGLPTGLPTLPTIIPTPSLPIPLGARAVAAATATASATANPCTTASATASGTKSATPTAIRTTASATPTASASTTPPPAFNPKLVKLTLKTTKEFVNFGSKITLSGTLSYSGVAVPNATVTITDKYSDGKVVPLGAFTTDAKGNFSHVDKPLYIGNVTAHYQGVNSNTVPIRVIIGYRSATVKNNGNGTFTLTTSTHPGFITGKNRQERVRLLLTDSHGNQKSVLGIVNAAQRSKAPAEAQGINVITFKNVDLGHGTFYVQVQVLGTPVNTGAKSKTVKVTL